MKDRGYSQRLRKAKGVNLEVAPGGGDTEVEARGWLRGAEESEGGDPCEHGGSSGTL
jgi:hypothetical protein